MHQQLRPGTQPLATGSELREVVQKPEKAQRARVPDEQEEQAAIKTTPGHRGDQGGADKHEPPHGWSSLFVGVHLVKALGVPFPGTFQYTSLGEHTDEPARPYQHQNEGREGGHQST